MNCEELPISTQTCTNQNESDINEENKENSLDVAKLGEKRKSLRIIKEQKVTSE